MKYQIIHIQKTFLNVQKALIKWLETTFVNTTLVGLANSHPTPTPG